MRRYPSYCCQSCGDAIGWIGRTVQWLRIPIHRCEPVQPWLIDRDGRVYKPTRRVVVKSKANA